MSKSTIYVYDENTGKIKYTVDQMNHTQIEKFEEKGEPFFVGPSGSKISGTFVKKDANTGTPIGVSPLEHMTFVNINKHVVVANGTDEAVISGLRNGMRVDVNHEHSYTVDDESGDCLELSCNNFSYVPDHNQMTIYLKAYGCYDSMLKVDFVEEE